MQYWGITLILKILTVEKLFAYVRSFSQLLFSLSLRDLEFEDGDFSSFYTTRNYLLDIFLCPQQVMFLPVLGRSCHVSLVERRASYRMTGMERFG